MAGRVWQVGDVFVGWGVWLSTGARPWVLHRWRLKNLLEAEQQAAPMGTDANKTGREPCRGRPEEAQSLVCRDWLVRL